MLVTFDNALPVLVAFHEGIPEGEYGLRIVPTGNLQVNISNWSSAIGENGLLVLMPDLSVLEDLENSEQRSLFFAGSPSKQLRQIQHSLAANPEFIRSKSAQNEVLRVIAADSYSSMTSGDLGERSLPIQPVLFPASIFESQIRLEDSEVTVSGLPSGGIYTWAAVGGVRLDQESALKVFLEDEAIRMPLEMPLQSAGPFEGSIRVRLGMTTSLGLIASPHCSITGTVVMVPDQSQVRVMLVYLQRPGRDPVSSLYAQEVTTIVPKRDGRFLFYDLGPGEYRISASWRVGNDYYCVTRIVELIAGDDVDLGVLDAHSSEALSVELVFQEDGIPIKNSQVFKDVELPTISADVLGLKFLDPLATFDGKIQFTPSTRIAIHGLPVGRWHAAISARELAPLIKEEYQILPGAQLSGAVNFPSERTISIVVPVNRPTIHYNINVQIPREAVGVHFLWQIYAENGSPQASGQVQHEDSDEGGSSTVLFKGGTGPYYFYVAIARPLKETDTVGWYGRAIIGGTGPLESINVPVIQGLTVVGKYHPKPGLPVHGKMLNFSVIGIGAEREITRNQHYVICDEQGAFSLIGVPQGALLKLERTEFTWTITDSLQAILVE